MGHILIFYILLIYFDITHVLLHFFPRRDNANDDESVMYYDAKSGENEEESSGDDEDEDDEDDIGVEADEDAFFFDH